MHLHFQAELEIFFKKLEEGLDFSLQHNRLATYKKWVFNENVNCSAAKLAEAGFYFVGNDDEPDSVTCFCCNKSLDSWDPEDDPWAEHLKHAPYCSFAKNRKSQNLYTVSDFIDLRNAFIIKLWEQHFEKTAEHLEKKLAQLKKKCT